MADVQHSTLSDPNLHEPKGASTAASGEIYVANGAGSGVWTPQIDLLDGVSGWGQYEDGTYTSGSPLTVTASTRTKLTNDAASTIDSQLPFDIGGGQLWNNVTNKITPVNAFDTYDTRLAFTANPLAGTSPFITLELDIGGGIGTIVSLTFPFTRGSGVPQSVIFTFPVYTGSTFVANGGEYYITPSNNTEIYDIGIFIKRTHKAR